MTRLTDDRARLLLELLADYSQDCEGLVSEQVVDLVTDLRDSIDGDVDADHLAAWGVYPS